MRIAPRQSSTAASQCPPPLEESTGQRLANTPMGLAQNAPCRESPTPPGILPSKGAQKYATPHHKILRTKFPLGASRFSAFLAPAFMWVYLLFSLVLFVNLLIAIFNDTYTSVQTEKSQVRAGACGRGVCACVSVCVEHYRLRGGGERYRRTAH